MHMAPVMGRPSFASLSCLHQGAKKSTVLERLVLRKQKAFGKGWTCIISLLGTPQEELVQCWGACPRALAFQGL